ncbi:MAG: hypothetical protein ACJ8HI_09535 [Massilia sp.]
MNIAKNMEIIFIAALALVSASTLANAAVPSHRAAPAAAVTLTVSPPATTMAVVTITAKRLSAAQKAALGN